MTRLGPFAVQGLTRAGLLAAAAFLVSLAIAASRCRRAGVPARLAAETHVLALGAGLACGHARSFAAAFPAVVHDMRAFARVVTAPVDMPLSVIGVAAAVAAMAWASGTPRAFLWCVAPGALLTAVVALGLSPIAASARTVALAVAAVVASLAWLLARSAAVPDRS